MNAVKAGLLVLAVAAAGAFGGCGASSEPVSLADGPARGKTSSANGQFARDQAATAEGIPPTRGVTPLPTPPPATATPSPRPTATVAAPTAPPTATPVAAKPTPAPRGRCDASYPDVCIPPAPPDLDCPDIPELKRFKVLQPDPHKLDGDFDGVGCER